MRNNAPARTPPLACHGRFRTPRSGANSADACIAQDAAAELEVKSDE